VSTKHLVPFFVLAGVHTAHADALADFQTGGSVRLSGATVDLGNGSRSSTGSVVIAKKAGSLDFAIQAQDLGVKLPVTVHLHGRPIGGDVIDYAIAETYSKIDLGGGHWLSGIDGHVYVVARPARGSSKQEVGNVKMVLARASSVTASTDFGKVPIAITQFDVLGGITQPALESFKGAGPTVCSGKTLINYRIDVTLVGYATASGASVELRSPERGVKLPAGVVVRRGARAATVFARIDPSFAGTVHLTATAGGVERSLDVVVYAPDKCPR
jgi:hypothetical protein